MIGVAHVYVPAFIEHFPYLGLFLLLVLGGLGLPFPEDATLILCGFLISRDIVKVLYALPVAYLGMLLADLFLYAMGRKYGRMILSTRRFRKILTPERLSVLEERFNRRGSLLILFGRHFLGLRAQLFLVAGVMRMSVLKFIIADGISALFTVAIMVGAGYAGGYSLDVVRRNITRVEHVGILLLVAALLVFVLLRHLRSTTNKER